MITCALQGGFANCAIQIASIYCLGLKNNTEAKFLLNSYTPLQGKNASSYSNTLFRLVPRLPDKSFQWKNFYEEVTFNYHDLPFSDDTIYKGYFQSYKYWEGYEKDVRGLFPPVYGRYSFPPKYTSVHIRRGDYKDNPGIFPLCTVQYYLDAMKMVGENNIFIICSDDIEWCKSVFTGKNIRFSQSDGDEIYDFDLMRYADNNIIANSSFSFLAAYLNYNTNRIVIRPKTWFGVGGPNADDITPDNWIRL